MSAALTALLTALADRGIAIAAEGDRLRVDAPVDALTPSLRSALAEHKAALLAHLAGDAQPTPPPEPEIVRIPLDGLSEYLAAHDLKVIGGTPRFGGADFRPMLFLADNAKEVAA